MDFGTLFFLIIVTVVIVVPIVITIAFSIVDATKDRRNKQRYELEGYIQKAIRQEKARRMRAAYVEQEGRLLAIKANFEAGTGFHWYYEKQDQNGKYPRSFSIEEVVQEVLYRNKADALNNKMLANKLEEGFPALSPKQRKFAIKYLFEYVNTWNGCLEKQCESAQQLENTDGGYDSILSTVELRERITCQFYISACKAEIDAAHDIAHELNSLFF